MKRIYHLAIVVLVLAASSCVREEIVRLDSSVNIVTLNTIFVAGSTGNVLSASLTRAGGSKPVAAGAILTVTSGGNTSEYTGYNNQFQTTFFPDVKVEAGETFHVSLTTAGQIATASCTVPQAPQTGECTARSSLLVPTYCRFDLEVIDAPGDSYYRLDPDAIIKGVRIYDRSTGKFIRDGGPELFKVVKVETFFEPLLGGFSETTNLEGMGLSQLLSNVNEYLVFDDNSFKDGKYALKLAIDMEDLFPTIEDGERYEVDFVLTLSSITTDGFHNYMAAQTRHLFGSSDLLTEPAIFPSNVQGGIGLVIAETPVDVTVTCSYPRRR